MTTKMNSSLPTTRPIVAGLENPRDTLHPTDGSDHSCPLPGSSSALEELEDEATHLPASMERFPFGPDQDTTSR